MLRSVVPFRQWHYEWLGGSCEPGGIQLRAKEFQQLEQWSSWTGIVDGDVVFCAGVIKLWATRHTCWALLHPERSKQHLHWITRKVREGLATVKGRIELTVRRDFPQGMRWAETLGFRIETPLLLCFGPEGEDHVGYVRVN